MESQPAANHLIETQGSGGHSHSGALGAGLSGYLSDGQHTDHGGMQRVDALQLHAHFEGRPPAGTGLVLGDRHASIRTGEAHLVQGGAGLTWVKREGGAASAFCSFRYCCQDQERLFTLTVDQSRESHLDSPEPITAQHQEEQDGTLSAANFVLHLLLVFFCGSLSSSSL